MTREQRVDPHRLGLFSDAVIAVVITIMVLELKAPEESTFTGLLHLWPTAISYLVSYLFIAIIWINHHHLLRFVKHVTPHLIWVNFAHLFGISLVPFATAWIANADVAPAPVTLYAGIFVFVNIAYRMFEKDALGQADASEMSPDGDTHRTQALARHLVDLRRRDRRLPVRTDTRPRTDLLRTDPLSAPRSSARSRGLQRNP